MRRTTGRHKDFVTSENVSVIELRVSRKDIEELGMDEISERIDQVKALAEKLGFTEKTDK